MSTAQANRIGYLGWSWSGNTDPILDHIEDGEATLAPSAVTIARALRERQP